MNKLKTDDPCNIKLWLMYFTTIIFPYMQKNDNKGSMSF